MKIEHEIELLRFITRTGMYISPISRDTIISFIHGLEVGSFNREFSEGFRQYLADKHQIRTGSTGWEGQLDQLVEKRRGNWRITFNRCVLDFIISVSPNDLKEEVCSLRSRIQTLTGRILTDEKFPEHNEQEWLSLYCSESTWFKELWSKDEWEILLSVFEKLESRK
jgi:hypothetical protein